MYLEESSNDEAMEELLEDEDDNEDIGFENERCGICTDVIIDRGVLDCCDHWFCFACIDNWATITNRCPLCKDEFQLITCLPVYDTTGSIRIENSSHSRDDDWSIQGKNNALSFPSYYIDEDAVICLDGDGCKIRNGLSTNEDVIALDTSIACDSCDLWYHACCVGFNPECVSNSSWLCPRCIPYEELPNVDNTSIQDQEGQSITKSTKYEWTIDPSLVGKVSVSVDDDGETAVVVSMVQGEHTSGDSRYSSSRNRVEIRRGKESEMTLCDSNDGDSKVNMQVDKIVGVELECPSLILNNEKGFDANIKEANDSYKEVLETSNGMGITQKDGELIENKFTSGVLKHVVSGITSDNLVNHISDSSLDLSLDKELSCHHAQVSISTEEKLHNQNSCSASCHTNQTYSGLSQDVGNLEAHLDVLVASSSADASDDKLVDAAFENIQDRSFHHSKICASSVDETFASATLDSADGITGMDSEVTGLAAKHGDDFNLHVTDSDSLNNQKRKRKGVLEVEMKAQFGLKKGKLDDKLHVMPSGSQNNASVSSYFDSSTAFSNEDIELVRQEEVTTADIMSIVQEVDHKSHGGQEGKKQMKNILDKREISAGLRVKKIMRRVGDKKETAILVQKLGKEIKDAVHDKFSSSDGKDDGMDGKLLTAFREAIVKSKYDVADKLDPSLITVRNQLLQKGKVRENLTKKIYGTSNGRRKRAWNRDWQIEFWKYRCSNIKHEKVETLQSVLELLKKASTSCSDHEEMDQDQGKVKDSILSRVYLADASVFPRKDDIKPLSAVAESSEVNIVRNEKNMFGILSEREKLTNNSQPYDNLRARFTDVQKVGKHLISSSSDLKGKAHTLKVPANPSASAKVGQDNQPIAARTDKRKWALEVLARKNALSNSVKHEQEDGSLLKGNFPLLVQLPGDMKPVPAPSRHNKVPISVRQAQLYRITEHYLRRTNLAAIQRTADTELAVADAVNVEKEISEKSNSKMVYINLCAQFLSQFSKLQADATMSNQMASTNVGNEVDGHMEQGPDQDASETISELTSTRYIDVEEALRDAGLFYSPPSSPGRNLEERNADAVPLMNDSVGSHENVLGIDAHTKLNTNVNFQYNVDNASCSASVVASASKVLGSEEGNSDVNFQYNTDNAGCSASVVPSASKELGSEEGIGKMKVMSKTTKNEVSNEFLDSDSEKTKHSEKVASKSNDDKALSDCQALFECQNLDSKGNVLGDIDVNVLSTSKASQQSESNGLSLKEGEELYGPEKDPLDNTKASRMVGEECKMMEIETAIRSNISGESENLRLDDASRFSKSDTEDCSGNKTSDHKIPLGCASFGGESSPTRSMMSETVPMEKSEPTTNKLSECAHSISKKVEAFVKEHVRPLCKSGVITVKQYKWAVGRTTDKVMSYHSKAKNANFLIKEGDKVKRLAEQYVEIAQQKEIK